MISNCGKVTYSKLHCGKVQRPDSAKASLDISENPYRSFEYENPYELHILELFF